MTTISPPAAYTPEIAALSHRLRDPDIAAALTRLLERADDIARAADTLTRAAERIPPAVATVTDIVDDACRSAAASGVDIDERMRLALRLADRLTAPRTVAALTALLDRVDLIERAIEMADRAPGFVAMAADAADEVLVNAAESGVDVTAGLTRGASAAIRFGALMGPDEVRSLEAVFRSGVLAPDAVRVIGGVGGALAAAAAEEPPRVGLVAMLRALRRPEVRRAMGFLLRFGTLFGRTLERPAPTAVPTVR